jgi:hypothetical protein
MHCHETARHKETTENVEEKTASSELTFTLNCPVESDAELGVGLVIRVYDEHDNGRWMPVGDVAFSIVEMSTRGMGKPIFSRPALTSIEKHARCQCTEDNGRCDANDHSLVENYVGLGYVYLFGNPKSNVTIEENDILAGHPVADILKLHEYLIKEQGIIDAIPKTDITKEYGNRQYTYPMQSYILALPPVDLDVLPSDSRKVFDDALKGHENVRKHLRSYRALYTRGESFYYFNGEKAAEVAWYEARLREVLTLRSHTDKEFLDMVKVAKASKSIGSEFRECLRIVAEVIRMHTLSRPYVNDFTIIPWKKEGNMIFTDEETGGIALPRDCEDNSWSVEAFHFTLLFGLKAIENNEMISALRSCAAMLGVPCAISGTFADPTAKLAKGESGHSFPIAIPFGVFAAQIGTTAPIKEFKQEFGFDLPSFHTKPAILDSVEVCTMFYGDHAQVSDVKRKALDITREWLNEVEGRVPGYGWLWEHYACQIPLDKSARGQGHAFRLTTDIFACMKSWRPANVFTAGESTSKSVSDASFIPRAFLVVSNLPEDQAERAYNELYPAMHAAGFVHEDWTKAHDEELMWSKEILQAGVNQFAKSTGVGKMGICIEMLMAPRLYDRKPVYKLFALPTPVQASFLDKKIRSAYARPMVPLVNGDIPDQFITETPMPVMKYTARERMPKLTSNERLVLRVYRQPHEVLDQDMEQLMERLGPCLASHKLSLVKLAFSCAVIFPLNKH